MPNHKPLPLSFTSNSKTNSSSAGMASTLKSAPHLPLCSQTTATKTANPYDKTWPAGKRSASLTVQQRHNNLTGKASMLIPATVSAHCAYNTVNAPPHVTRPLTPNPICRLCAAGCFETSAQKRGRRYRRRCSSPCGGRVLPVRDGDGGEGGRQGRVLWGSCIQIFLAQLLGVEGRAWL